MGNIGKPGAIGTETGQTVNTRIPAGAETGLLGDSTQRLRLTWGQESGNV